MFISADTMGLLFDLGVTGEKLVELVRSLERDAVVTAPKSTGAERQRRYRERKASDVTRDVTSDASLSDAGSPSLPSSPQTPQQPTHPPVEITTRVKAGPKPTKRCPAAWAPSPEDLAAEPQLTPGEIERELAKFRDHTFGTARSDWSATFRNWIRRAAESKPRNDRSSNQTQPRTDRVSRMLAGAVAAADGP